MERKSVSVFIAAYNEEQNIRNAVKSVMQALHGVVSDWEIIIIDDGSTDNTHTVTEELKKRIPGVKVIHHKTNKGIGAAFITALQNATKTYFTVFPGDDDMAVESLRKLFTDKTNAEIIFSYPTELSNRSAFRKILSQCFINSMNILFRLRIKYYNGPFIVKTALVSELHLISRDFLIFAEMKIRLIKNGVTYKETSFRHVGRKHGNSKAISTQNIISSARTTVLLLKDIYFK